DAERLCAAVEIREIGLGERIDGVREQSDATQGWEHFAHQLERLFSELRRRGCDAGDIAAGASEAGDEAGPNRIARRDPDRNLARRILGGVCGWGLKGDQDVNLAPDEIGSERGEPFWASLGRPEVQLYGSADDIAQRRESFLERYAIRLGIGGNEDAVPRD